jgi:hypothetical protein
MDDESVKSEVKQEVYATSGRMQPAIYANQVAFGGSDFDLQLTFSVIRANFAGPPILENVTTIVMSLQHAKVFSQNLTKALESWEKQNGEIVIPIKTKRVTTDEKNKD